MESFDEVFSSQMMLLTRPAAYLKRIGIKDALDKRFTDTWHTDTLKPHWASTIGLWGGVAHHETIIARARVNYNVFKLFRQRNALSSRHGTLGHLRPQYDLAFSAFLRWKTVEGGPTVQNINTVSSHFGILPIELRTYVDRVEGILAELDMAPADLLTRGVYEIVAPHWVKHSEDIDAFVTSTYSHFDD